MNNSENRQKSLAKNTLILTVGKVCTQGINFFLLPLYTAILSPDEYGIVDIFNSYISLLVPLVNMQYDLGLFRFMLDNRDNSSEIKKIFSTVFNANVFQCIVYLLLFFIIQPFISSEYKIFLAIDVVLNVFFNTLLQLARGLGHNGSYSFASFLSAGLMVVLNVIFIAVLRMGAIGLFLATVIAKMVSLIYLMISQKIFCYYESVIDRSVLKNINKYSLPLVPTQLSWWVLNVSDRTIVTHFLGVAINGIYSVANKFSMLYMTFYNIFNMAWTELVALHINDEDSEEFFTKTFQMVFSLFSAACLGIIAVMPFAYPLLIDEEYITGYNHAIILLIAALMQVVCGLYSVVYLAVKKSKESAKTAFAAATINIIVNLGFVHYIGLYAASVSTFVAFGIMAVYRYFDSQKYLKMRFKGRILFSTLIIGCLDCVLVLYNRFETNILNLVIVVIYATIINLDLIKTVLSSMRKERMQ